MTILIVDDEELARLATRHVLYRMGYADILECSSGEAALVTIRGQRPDIVIADIKMTEMDGIELLRAVRAEKLETLFIYLSGYNLFQYAQKALQYGAFAYLLKPVDAKELHAILDSAKAEIERRQKKQLDESKMRQALRENRKGQIQAFISNLIFGRQTETAYITNKLHSLQLEFSMDGYCVALFHIEPNSLGSVERDTALLLYGIENIAMEILQDRKITAYGFVTQNDLCLLCNYDPGQFAEVDDLKGCFLEIESKCREFLHPRVLAGIGCVTDLKQCYEGYCAAEHMIKNRKRLEYADFAANTYEIMVLFPEKQAQIFSNFVLKEKPEQAMTCLQELFVNYGFRKDSNWGICCNLCLYTVVFLQCILNSAAVIFGRTIWSEEVLINEITQIEDMDDVLSWLHEKCNQCVQVLRQGRTQNMKGDSLQSVIDATLYVCTHLDQQLSLETMAQRFSYTPSYFSRIYRQNAGVSFLKSATHIRMWEARRLLLGSNEKVQDIAKKVGFQDTKYFIGVFKQHTGLQPNAYRKKYRF